MQTPSLSFASSSSRHVMLASTASRRRNPPRTTPPCPPPARPTRLLPVLADLWPPDADPSPGQPSRPRPPARGSPGGAAGGEGRGAGRRLTRLLLNVTVQRSLGPVQVVLPQESTAADLIRAAVEAYAYEGRRPPLPDTDPGVFELHYSQFSLESLSREEKVVNLGSRYFFLCQKPKAAAGDCDFRADEPRKAAAASSSQPFLPLFRAINTALVRQ